MTGSESKDVTAVTALRQTLVTSRIMKTFVFTSACILFIACRLECQSSSRAILRIERVQDGEAVCALISDDGGYRLEKMFQNKNEMYNGTMDISRLEHLRQLLRNEQLSSLSQTDIHKPLITDTADDVQLAIRRDAGWQELVFLAPASRKPFRESLEPLLHWFQDLQKQRPSATRVTGLLTSCMPPPEAQVKLAADLEPKKNGAVSDFSGYCIYSGHVYHGRVDANCTVVFAHGHFRREHGGQTFMQERRDTITEGQIDADAVRQLKEILNGPTLVDSPDNPKEPPQWVMEGSWTHLDVPRKDKLQKLLFETTFNTLNRHTDIGGKSNMDYRISDKRVLEPLTRWMKEYTDARSGTQAEGVGNDCYPGKKIADLAKPAQ